MKIGDYVKKKSGYDFAGVIVSVFQNTKGETRYVVECIIDGAKGWLMIFNEDQLELL